MSGIEVVTSGERHDLDEEARAAFRPTWPEFIFHGAAGSEYLSRVETYFPYYDVMLLEEGRVVAGAWAVRTDPADNCARRCGHASENTLTLPSRRASTQPCPARPAPTGCSPMSAASATGCQNSASLGWVLVNSPTVIPHHYQVP
jgi:hypothetical protein